MKRSNLSISPIRHHLQRKVCSVYCCSLPPYRQSDQNDDGPKGQNYKASCPYCFLTLWRGLLLCGECSNDFSRSGSISCIWIQAQRRVCARPRRHVGIFRVCYTRSLPEVPPFDIHLKVLAGTFNDSARTSRDQKRAHDDSKLVKSFLSTTLAI